MGCLKCLEWSRKEKPRVCRGPPWFPGHSGGAFPVAVMVSSLISLMTSLLLKLSSLSLGFIVSCLLPSPWGSDSFSVQGCEKNENALEGPIVSKPCSEDNHDTGQLFSN